MYTLQATAVVEAGLLLMSVMCVLLPAVLHHTHTEMQFGKSELALSRFSSSIMLLAYAANIIFQIKSESNIYLPLNEVGLMSQNQSLQLLSCYYLVYLCRMLSYVHA